MPTPTLKTFDDLPMRPARRRMLGTLISAGSRGVTSEALCRAFYDDGPVPQAGLASARCQIQRLRSQLTPIGFGVANIGGLGGRGGASGVFVLMAESAPIGAPAAAATEDRSATVPTPQRGRAGGAFIDFPVLVDLKGAPAALQSADRAGPNRTARTCRWPNDAHPRDAGFRFCGEVVTTSTVPVQGGTARQNPYCDACREKAHPKRQDVFRPPVLGHSAFAAPRQVEAGALRFGRKG